MRLNDDEYVAALHGNQIWSFYYEAIILSGMKWESIPFIEIVLKQLTLNSHILKKIKHNILEGMSMLPTLLQKLQDLFVGMCKL